MACNETSALEPVALAALADALYGQRWLDMRVVEMGTLQRVQIQQINVHRTRDEVVLTQKWNFGDEVRSDIYVVDAEDIRWAVPSSVELFDVTPIRRPARPCDDPSTQVEHIAGAATFVYGLPPDAIYDPRARALHARQVCMWAVYETTDLSPSAIARSFGYKSQMPMQTIQDKMRWGDQDFIREVADLVEIVEEKNDARFRRQTPKPWPTVL